MRITGKSTYDRFLSSLGDIQEKQSQAQIKLSTGQDIIALSDAPTRSVDVKNSANMIDRLSNYKNVVDESVNEMQNVDETLKNISDNVQKMRQLAIDTTDQGASQGLDSMAFWVKGYMDDIVKQANTDFDGHFLFSGTKTTGKSINPADPIHNSTPYEIIQGAVTPANPSGLSIVFRGNNEDRTINKDNQTTEIINTKSNEIFGQGGTAVFQTIIDLYNVLSFNDDGTKRDASSHLSDTDTKKVNDLQRQLADIYDQINTAAGKNGTKLERLGSISDQMTSEITRLKDYKSMKGDANVAQVAMDLQKEQTALNYTLQVGSKINKVSLFDFLA